MRFTRPPCRWNWLFDSTVCVSNLRIWRCQFSSELSSPNLKQFNIPSILGSHLSSARLLTGTSLSTSSTSDTRQLSRSTLLSKSRRQYRLPLVIHPHSRRPLKATIKVQGIILRSISLITSASIHPTTKTLACMVCSTSTWDHSASTFRTFDYLSRLETTLQYREIQAVALSSHKIATVDSSIHAHQESTYFNTIHSQIDIDGAKILAK